MRDVQYYKELFDCYGGMMWTIQLTEEKVFYPQREKLITDGYVEKIRRGYYQWVNPDDFSEVGTVACLFPDGVFCMDTALRYYGYSDRTPKTWHLAVSKDSGKSRFHMDYLAVKPYYMEPAVLELGLTSGNIDGHEIRIYDKDRLICDCLRYYVEGNHEAIISPAVFDMVQAELARRTKGGSRYGGVSIFSNKIKCVDCGGWYGSKVWHSTDRYRRGIYRCNRKYNGEKCETPHVTEEDVKAAFVSAYNQLVTEKKEIIANAEIIRRTLCVTDTLQGEKHRLEDEMSVQAEMTQNIIAENARMAQDQEEYQKRYGSMVKRYDTAKAQYDEVVAAISVKEAQDERLTRKPDGISG